MNQLFAATALALSLAACSPEPSETPETTREISHEAVPPTPTPSSSPTTTPAAYVLTLEGLGPLRIGQRVPEGSGWAERGARISDECRTISSPDHPGVHAIVEGGEVRRITVGQRSDVKLVEGIGVGSTEAQARAAFPGFREEPHKYGAAPAKYLTAPNAAGGDPALRFEINAEGKVGLMHVGTMPVLAYVEGCA